MSKSDLDSFLDYHKYSDFEEFRNLLAESPLVSGFLQNNSCFDLFNTNNILQQSNACYQHIPISNNHFCWQTNPQTANDQIASKRASNTIFKTSASQFRKVIAKMIQSIFEYVRQYSTFSWVEKKLKQTNRINNLSLFPKLLAIVIQLDIQSQIGQIWKCKSSQTLEKKRQLMRSGKFCSERFRQLQKSITTMNACMNQKDIVQALDIYWGKYRQVGKYEKCKREVLNYQKQLKRLKYLHEENIQKQKNLRERAKEQIFSTKNPQTLQFQNDLIAFPEQKCEVFIFQRVSNQFQKLSQ